MILLTKNEPGPVLEIMKVNALQIESTVVMDSLTAHGQILNEICIRLERSVMMETM